MNEKITDKQMDKIIRSMKNKHVLHVSIWSLFAINKYRLWEQYINDGMNGTAAYNKVKTEKL